MSIRILHIISGLTVGGAETMLCKLLAQWKKNGESESLVVCLSKSGPMQKRIEAHGAEVRTLGAGSILQMPLGLRKLRAIVQAYQPDLIQTWMYHADLAGALCAKKTPLVWNIRHSHLRGTGHKWTTRVVASICAHLSSRAPDWIICNSQTGKHMHIQFGYCADKFRVLPNGFDTDVFCPNVEAGVRLRHELGVTPDSQLIGYVARMHPQKDHETFLKAARDLRQERKDVHFVLVGRDVKNRIQIIKRYIVDSGLSDCVHILGERADMPSLQAAWDIASMTARSGEGFPNVLGEAMSCAVPCVTTDVGDAADVVGDTGRVVPIENPNALAAAWKQILAMDADERKRLGRKARERILSHYSLESIAEKYLDIYREVLRDHA